jgi:pimeloyl-ACP methyl ester carboxylesterase
MGQPSKPFSFKRLGKSVLITLVGLYLALCIFMAVVQRSLLYHPHVYSSEEVDQRAQEANLERWVDSEGANIGLKRPSPKQPAEGSVLITYGNGSTAVGCEGYANDIQKVAAMDIYILEYPGYEDRPGKPTEKSLFAAARDAFEMLPTNQPVYLVGQSLGTGVASYLAGTYTNRVAGIVLISPFNSTTAVGQHRYPILPVWLLLVDHFPSDYYLQRYHGKVGITVDGQDAVVPEKFGLRLYHDYDGPKKLWEFPNGGHCEIYDPHTKFWKEAVTFWRSN